MKVGCMVGHTWMWVHLWIIAKDMWHLDVAPLNTKIGGQVMWEQLRCMIGNLGPLGLGGDCVIPRMYESASQVTIK